MLLFGRLPSRKITCLFLATGRISRQISPACTFRIGDSRVHANPTKLHSARLPNATGWVAALPARRALQLREATAPRPENRRVKKTFPHHAAFSYTVVERQQVSSSPFAV